MTTEARPRRRHAAAASRVAVAGLSTTTMLGLTGLLAATERPADPVELTAAEPAEVVEVEQPAPAPAPQEHIVVVIRRHPAPASGVRQPQQPDVPVSAARPAPRRTKARPKPRPAAPVTRSHGSR